MSFVPLLAQASDTAAKPGETLAGLIVATGLGSSLVFWLKWVLDHPFRERAELRLNELSNSPDSVTSDANGSSAEDSRSTTSPLLAYAIACGWIILMVGVKLLPFLPGAAVSDQPKVALTVDQLTRGVWLELVLQMLISGVLAAALGPHIDWSRWRRQSIWNEVRIGLMGFVAAVGPVLILMLASSVLRTDETEHELLRMIKQFNSTGLVVAICVTAVVGAPIAEELTYRVALMSGMSRNLGKTGGLLAASAVFAAVHGVTDMIPLFPLALLLGWIYQRTRSYIAVVVMHAAFNGFNLGIVLLRTWLDGPATA